ncbi:MAG: endolytic transglycosylase MltG [Gallionella sp.]|nr:endolytic transglycosylase MltG [Gallionella sp.]
MKKRFLLLVLSLLMLALALSYAYRPMSLPGTPFEFHLQAGSNVRVLARDLRAQGLFEQEWPFVWLARLTGQSAQIKAGSYELTQPVSPLQLLEILTQGQVSQRRLSVIEGWTFRQMRQAIDAHPDLLHDTKNLDDAELLRRIGVTESAPEGLFFPDTYNFSAGSSDLEVYKRAYLQMQQVLQKAWAERAGDSPLRTPYEALTLASIVEKETGSAADRGMIAGVFVNRLRKGMLLQTDPTVIYGLGSAFDGNLRKRDLLADTPYNTYTRAGLTPTPISLPGAAAIHVSLHPAETDALYFVARGDGSSYFSSTLAEHNQAVNRYQK